MVYLLAMFTSDAFSPTVEVQIVGNALTLCEFFLVKAR